MGADDVWGLAGVVGHLPPEFVRAPVARVAKEAIFARERLLRTPNAHLQRLPAALDPELMRDVERELSGWVDRADQRATEHLGVVSPKNVLNLVFFYAAVSKLRGSPNPIEVPLKRWLWVVAAGGAGTKLGHGIVEFLQAAQDWRNLLTLQHSLRPVDSFDVAALSPLDHDVLTGVRTRFGWSAAEVARQIVLAAEPRIARGEFESLVDYLDELAHSSNWFRGAPETMPGPARALAAKMAIRAGEYHGRSFSSLSMMRGSVTHPFVNVDGTIIPANLEAATTRLHLPVLELARADLRPKQSAALVEDIVGRILARCDGVRVHGGDARIAISPTDIGELDILATDRSCTHVLNVEVKAHYEGQDVPTTAKGHANGIGGVQRQLARRKKAFAGGESVTIGGTPLALSKDARFIGLAVLLHEYSGLIWRPERLGERLGANMITIADLAVVTTALNDDRELFSYLDFRDDLLGDGRGYASDETDILALFLSHSRATLQRMLRKRPRKSVAMVPSREVPSDLVTSMRAPTREKVRTMLRDLPLVRI
ncbi:hypothetical protein [Microbacterium sp. GXS0129]|uniref:hypothetical protein n=1 Tax=Microbacterium sp. GXS0129 TaxID=3377836 RepID=UPI00383B09C8